jgi:hypothetical protein
MAGDLDIVGGVGVDVVPVIPNFHTKLKAVVLPIADKVGVEAGKAMGDKMADTIGEVLKAKLPSAISSAITVAGGVAQKSAVRQGEQTGGAFARSLKAKLEAAFRAMPKLDVKLSDTGVDAELARLRAKLEQLSRKRIGIDIDAATARAQVDEIEAKLTALGARHPNIAVRADTAVARAALAEFRAEIDAVDARDPVVRVKADTSQAEGALFALAIQIGILTAIPAVPVLAAGIGAIGSAALASAAGVGSLALVAVPAIKGISTALQAKTAAEKESTTATSSGVNAAVQAQQRALAMAGAQQALAAAHRNAAQSIRAANDQISQAERAVTTAERSLTDAKKAAKQAEEDLTQARADASKQLRDLNDQLRDGDLAQREATLRVTAAQEDLNAVLADPKATQLQRDEAQLTLDQALQAQKEQKQSYADLQKSAAAQKKAGVDGNDAVKAATDRLANAQRNVKDQAQAVVDAQKRVADAVRNAANAQVAAAESIASAERGVQSARLSGMTTTAKAATKADAYREALAKLSPTARDLYDAIAGPKGLSAAFKTWSTSLQPDVLPLFTRGVDGAKNTLPTLTPLVHAAADAVKTLMDRASVSLKSPFWQGFKDDIANSAEPAIVGLGISFGNLIKGMAGVVDAFLPHMDGISLTMQRITGRFAKWSENLKGSPEFENFLKYVKDNSPKLAEFLGNILGAVADVSKSLAPLSTAMFGVLNPIIDGISWIATNVPEAVQLLWGLYTVNKVIALAAPLWAAAMVIYAGAVAGAAGETWSWAAAIQATGIVPLIELIVLAVAALVIGIIEAYKHVGWFKAAVDGAWTGIKVATLFLWNFVLKPAFEGIWWAMKKIGDIAVWLWQHAIGPAFRFIWEAAKILATILIILVIGPMYLGFKVLGAVALWLWTHAFRPAFGWIGKASLGLWNNFLKPVLGWIGDKIGWLWTNVVKPQFTAMKLIFHALGDAGSWLWKHALKPVFGWIADGAEVLWKYGVKPWFDLLKKGVSLVADAFESAKDNIKTQWDALKSIAKTPIKFIIDHVYNNGIVPLWNRVAGITGAHKLKKMGLEGFATGGVLSGYSPGRDDRVIAVGGGEAVMRPEWTRAVGADRINSWNAAARSGGVSGVQRAIGDGMPAFSLGGVVDDIWGGLKKAGGTIADGVSGAADFITNPDKVFNSASKWIQSVMHQFATSKWGQMATDIPVGMLKSLKNSIFGGSDGTPTGPATGGVGRALLWARTQAGKPYQWGGAGNPSFDCSGFMGSIQKVIEGLNPLGRVWSTASFQGSNAPAGWVKNLNSPFRIGVTNAGVGHTAGTLAGVNVESRGGRGVIVGSGARGWNDPLFPAHYGFAPAMGAKLYDDGGYLQPGMNLIANGTGKPEPVFTAGQWDDIRTAKTSSPTIQADVKVYVGDREITDIVRTEVVAREDSSASAILTGRVI